MSAVGGRTTASRIRINRPDAGSARCSASRARAQRKDFSPLTLPSSTPSTSNATSLPLQRIAFSAPRRRARGARQSRLLKISRAAAHSRSFVGNVTRPARELPLSKFWGCSGASGMTFASLMRTAGVEPRRIYAGWQLKKLQCCPTIGLTFQTPLKGIIAASSPSGRLGGRFRRKRETARRLSGRHFVYGYSWLGN